MNVLEGLKIETVFRSGEADSYIPGILLEDYPCQNCFCMQLCASKNWACYPFILYCGYGRTKSGVKRREWINYGRIPSAEIYAKIFNTGKPCKQCGQEVASQDHRTRYCDTCRKRGYSSLYKK